MNYDVLIVGCGLCGAVCARQLAEFGKKVCILERRNHIGGNMYDYKNENGILVHKYGPHTFHTNKRILYEYICRYSKWKEFRLNCKTFMNGKYTPMPFNFETIDIFYERTKADSIKKALEQEFPDQATVSILELLQHSNEVIKEYAAFLYENDYKLYTAKQWGVNPKEIDPSVLRRVPVRLNYETGYFNDKYQVMPEISYISFFENLLNSPSIKIRLDTDAKNEITFDEITGSIFYQNRIFKGSVIYTGPIDELFQIKYGTLPYRSLEFKWKTEHIKSFQEAPVVAYPQVEDFTRITEYTKLPVQDAGNITVYAMEYPITYTEGRNEEPYYPVRTTESKKSYLKYKKLASRYKNLYLCGRLADFQYYNMDQALERALDTTEEIICSGTITSE